MATRGVVPFGEQSWEQEADGVRALVCQVDGARWAIVEYAPGSGRPEFCEVGHEGYVISGEIEYEFESGGKIVAKAGEGFVLPTDDMHRGFNHGTEPARLLVIDELVTLACESPSTSAGRSPTSACSTRTRGVMSVAKVPSTPADPIDAVIDGVRTAPPRSTCAT